MARSTNFNKEQMDVLYDNLEQMMSLYNFEPSQIINIDETGLSSVLQAPKVLAASGTKQVGQIVSNERGEQVTVTGIVSAAGEVIPPVFLFPRKRVHEEYMEGCPDGSIAIFNGSGWMNGEAFIKVLKHVVTHKNPSKENPILIILDNHSSHSTLEAIKFCRDNGIHMVSFPPHTTHRAQPLDITVFGPFKTRCKTLFNKWLGENPGMRITIHNIVRVSADAIRSAFTAKNIRSGFAKAGICPLDRSSLFRDRDVLGDDDGPSSQPEQTRLIKCSTCSTELSNPTTPATKPISDDLPAFPKPISLGKSTDSIGGTESTFTSLEDLRPIPKPSARLGKRGMQSAILTSSPEKRKKEELEEKKAKRNEKKSAPQEAKRNTRRRAQEEKGKPGIVKIEKIMK